MLSGRSYLLFCGIEQLEGIYLNDSMEERHFRFRKAFPNDIIDKQDLRFGMIYEMMDISRFEFMKKRDRNGAVSEGRDEGYSTVCLVS